MTEVIDKPDKKKHSYESVYFEPAVEHIVGKQQKAYIGNNNIGICITNLINMVTTTNSKKINALILLIDFRKAFDSLDQEFIQTALGRISESGSVYSLIKGRPTFSWEDT